MLWVTFREMCVKYYHIMRDVIYGRPQSYDFSLVRDLLSKVKAKFNIVEDEESNRLQIYERELSVTQQVDSIKSPKRVIVIRKV